MWVLGFYCRLCDVSMWVYHFKECLWHESFEARLCHILRRSDKSNNTVHNK